MDVVVVALAPDGAPWAPGARLAGLSLLARAALTLDGAVGPQRILVVTSACHLAAVDALRCDRRLRAALDVIVLPDLPVDTESHLLPPPVLDAVRRRPDAPRAPFLCAWHDALGDPAIARTLAAAPATPTAVAAREGHALARAPCLVSPEAHDDGVALVDVADAWHADARTPEGRARARHHLFEACRKPADGIVSRHLNRHISIAISKRLVDLPVSPNAMTALTFAVGLAAACIALAGSYAHTLVAALLMQCNSILDGVDGELARVRLEGSRLGQWLDTLGDDASNVAFWAALGWGARAAGDAHADWLATSGFVAAGANALAAAQSYWQLARLGTGDLNVLVAPRAAPRPGLAGAVARLFGVVLRQDFFLLLVLVLALAGVLHQALPLVALGALVTLGAATARTVAALRQ
jgi:phosphatidylglycerophosphate synthase